MEEKGKEAPRTTSEISLAPSQPAPMRPTENPVFQRRPAQFRAAGQNRFLSVLIRVHPWLKKTTAWFQLRKHLHPIDPVNLTTQQNSPTSTFTPLLWLQTKKTSKKLRITTS
jgi:hypothetical protein